MRKNFHQLFFSFFTLFCYFAFIYLYILLIYLFIYLFIYSFFLSFFLPISQNFDQLSHSTICLLLIFSLWKFNRPTHVKFPNPTQTGQAIHAVPVFILGNTKDVITCRIAGRLQGTIVLHKYSNITQFCGWVIL